MKKAQAAMEFLMTYGWAILVVMVVIGSLAYFGILNPSILLPEKCTLQMGLYCKNHLLTQDNKVFLNLENGMGKGIIITEIFVSGDVVDCNISTTRVGTAPNDMPYNDDYNGRPGWHIENGESRIINLTNTWTVPPLTPADRGNCSIASWGGKIKAELKIKWYYDDANEQFTHAMKGEILARIEST